MIKVMFILSEITIRLELWTFVNHNSLYENPGLKVFKNKKNLGEISNNWPKYLFGINV